jgi:hypothetical protein
VFYQDICFIFNGQAQSQLQLSWNNFSTAHPTRIVYFSAYLNYSSLIVRLRKLEMKDNLNLFGNERLPQSFWIWKTTSIVLEMEDGIK